MLDVRHVNCVADTEPFLRVSHTWIMCSGAFQCSLCIYDLFDKQRWEVFVNHKRLRKVFANHKQHWEMSIHQKKHWDRCPSFTIRIERCSSITRSIARWSSITSSIEKGPSIISTIEKCPSITCSLRSVRQSHAAWEVSVNHISIEKCPPTIDSACLDWSRSTTANVLVRLLNQGTRLSHYG